MKTRHLWPAAVVAGAGGLVAALALADRPTAAQPLKKESVVEAAAPNGGTPADRDAIQKNAEAFIAAFHAGDARAVAAFWAPDGEFTDLSGRRLKGREAIEALFEGLFKQARGLQTRIESDSLRFLTPDVAIEEGTSFVLAPDGSPPSRARYTNVHVRKDGQWLLGSVRETPYVPPSNYEHLRSLEGIVGDWSSENPKGEAERLSVSWAANQNFLVGSFTATVNGVSVGQATHWIGWDPVAKRVRSWIFDAAGGFGEGAWTREGDRWVIRTTSVLQDGKKASATITLALADPETLTLQARDRTVDGKEVPDRKEFKLKRVK